MSDLGWSLSRPSPLRVGAGQGLERPEPSGQFFLITATSIYPTCIQTFNITIFSLRKQWYEKLRHGKTVIY